MFPADVTPFQKLAGKTGHVILPGLGCSGSAWIGFPSSKSFSPAGFVMCCCSPCGEELTVTVLSPPPAQGFCFGHSKLNQGKPSEKNHLADLYWREAACARRGAAGRMQICNPSCWLAHRLLTASCSPPEGSFLRAALLPVVALPEFSWQALRRGC